ncbi:MAG TPA: hypothetical protein VF475_07765 [Sphingobium sp.]
MKNALILSSLALAFGAGGCGVHDIAAEYSGSDAVSGETPMEVASALQRMGGKLPPAKAAQLSYAVDTLTRVVPDKHDSRTVGEMSPQFVSMMQGRNADQIIQLATLYRDAAPPDRH